MKKIFLLAAAICALCACNKEGEKNSDPVVTKVEVLCEVDYISSDMLDNYDFYYDYTDFEGAKHSEQLTGERKISFIKENPGLSDVGSNPFTIALRVEAKSGAAEKDFYDATHSITIGVNGYYENGELAPGSYSFSRGYNCIEKNARGVLPKSVFPDYCCIDIAEEATTYEIYHCKTYGQWDIDVRVKL